MKAVILCVSVFPQCVIIAPVGQVTINIYMVGSVKYTVSVNMLRNVAQKIKGTPKHLLKVNCCPYNVNL